MKRLIFASIALCIATQSIAIGSVTAKVSRVRIDQDGRGMVIFGTSVKNSAATCVDTVNFPNALAFNATNNAGKAILAVALAAKATGAIITAYGASTCGIYDNRYVEDWATGEME